MDNNDSNKNIPYIGNKTPLSSSMSDKVSEKSGNMNTNQGYSNLNDITPKESENKLKRFFEEWNVMREKRSNYELSYDDYIEWKLQYDINKGVEYEEDS